MKRLKMIVVPCQDCAKPLDLPASVWDVFKPSAVLCKDCADSRRGIVSAHPDFRVFATTGTYGGE